MLFAVMTLQQASMLRVKGRDSCAYTATVLDVFIPIS